MYDTEAERRCDLGGLAAFLILFEGSVREGRGLVAIAVSMAACVGAASAQDYPDLSGTWTGTRSTVTFAAPNSCRWRPGPN